jgi:hypothetical protein
MTIPRLSFVSVKNSRNRSSIGIRLPANSIAVGAQAFFDSRSGFAFTLISNSVVIRGSEGGDARQHRIAEDLA